MMTEKPIKVLLVEDDPDCAAIFRAKLSLTKNCQFVTSSSDSLKGAFDSLKQDDIDVVLLDLTLRDSQGIDTVVAFYKRVPHMPIIVLTALNDEKLALEAVRRGAQDYLIKGEVDNRMLERIVCYAYERKRVEEILRSQQLEQQTIFNSVPAIIMYKDSENRILRANQTAAESFGLTNELLEGKSLAELCPDEAERYHLDDLEVIETGRPKLGIIEQYQRSTGEKRWLRTDKLPYRDEKGNIVGVIVFSVDITAAKQVEDNLRQSEKRLRRQSDVLVELAKGEVLNSGELSLILKEITKADAETLEVERVTVWLYEKDYSKVYCADQYELTPDKHIGGLGLISERYPEYFESLEKNRFISVHNVHSDPRTRELAETYFYPLGITSILDAPIRLNGKTVGVLCHEHVGPARMWSVDEQHFAASMADLIALAMGSCEKKRAEERLNHLAYYDPLTDLPNRVLFIDRLNQAMISARRHQYLVAVMFLDLDHFKRIVDTLGHAVGDELLRAVATRLKKTLYDTDTLTRISGDEFTILAPDLKKTDDVIKVAEKIFNVFRAPFLISGQELYMTVSMGISIFPNDGVDSVTLLKNSDTAMYQAKEKGRNNYRLYSSAMSVKAFERLILENSLRRALEKNELKIYYQPQIDISTRSEEHT
ncbi:MAG: diguanylate cyclase, partial [Candidatus Omnitrophica bacterium]|nr:diguanylate cyclase [Candidatus Omnitrophota bacterium]